MSSGGESNVVSSFYHHKMRRSAMPQQLDDATALQELINTKSWNKDEAEFMRAPSNGKRLFKVCITNIRAQDLAAKDVGGTSDPYIKLKWPEALENKTSVVQKTLNAVWKDFNWEFEYEVDFSTNLTTKSFELECFDKDVLSDEIIGKASIDLFTIVAGPKEYELNLLHRNQVNGVVRFNVSMKELVFPQLKLKTLYLSNLGNHSTVTGSITYHHKGSSHPYSESFSMDLKGSSSIHMKGFDVLKIKCFLEELVDQSVVISVIANGSLLLEHKVDIRAICPLEKSKNNFQVSFEKDNTKMIADLEWIQFPNCAQMRRGQFSSSKGISKSILLIKGVLTPIVSFFSPPFIPEFQQSEDDEHSSENMIPAEPAASPKVNLDIPISSPSSKVENIAASSSNANQSASHNPLGIDLIASAAIAKAASNVDAPQLYPNPFADVKEEKSSEHLVSENFARLSLNQEKRKSSDGLSPPAFDADDGIDLPSYLKEEIKGEVAGENALPPPGYDNEEESGNTPQSYPALPNYMLSPESIPPAVESFPPKKDPVVNAAPAVEIKLPQGFEKKIDAQGKTFYVDNFLKSTSFEAPVPLPSGWERAYDPVKNKIFYVNHVEKKTQWDHPSAAKPVSAAPVASPAVVSAELIALPQGYEKRIDPSSGKTIYIDHFLKSTSWNAPEPLPKGWERSIDPKTGKVFYIDHASKKTSWEFPKVAASVAGASVAVAAAGALSSYPQQANSAPNASVPNPLAGYPMGENDPNPMLNYPGVSSSSSIPAAAKPAEKPAASAVPQPAIGSSYFSNAGVGGQQSFMPISAPASIPAGNTFLSSGQRAAPVALDKGVLPSGYEKRTDPKSGRVFYVDNFLKSTTWDPPAQLPEGWDRGFDAAKNRVYYINHFTKSTQWDIPTSAAVQPALAAAKPVTPAHVNPVQATPASNIAVASFAHKSSAALQGLPDGYEQSKMPDGRTYYIDHFTKNTSWDKPASLPAGWTRCFDSKTQKPYYQNSFTKATQWTVPTESVAAAIPATPAVQSVSPAVVGAVAGAGTKLPEGIEVMKDGKSGKAYYCDHFLKTTSWDTPRHIPSHWERAFDAKTKRVYYIDHKNKRTQFEHP